jgi:hypothetical protein
VNSPTKRTLDYLRSRGYAVGVVERWIPQARKRVDLLGFIDILAIRDDETLAVQSTSASGGNLMARVRKAQALPTFAQWLAEPHRAVEFIGWRQLKRGYSRPTWVPDVRRYDSCSTTCEAQGCASGNKG